ncbi:DUF1428 domain-containing protein [Dehalogenimonas etheniformans]|uniref:DUF1428 domain-containing protein n=1 Tax=Dehalogenimonas etheniformans TaxID=1536648 RepID=A0A2P5P4U3_9CHLR|nr:DUF1428 domain-containing protein [Dehalogenimonas etheniformans]PPD57314.1 DUF1428 domain-containing protein [Dehalogenimonas etheniformans]QNT77032.1 DUF1428 domain-containing protein [Dehalogenimonas etheniformans]
MRYVDGFVIVVPKGNLEAYRKLAEESGQIWKKYGALEYVECIGDDLNPETPGEMKGLTFPEIAGAKTGETVAFSFIVYKSREHRDEVNAKVMADPFMNTQPNQPMPFDVKRTAFGGFKAIVDL